MFTEADKKDYAQHLKREIREEKKQPQTVAKMFNLNNLYADLNNIEGNDTTTA